MITRKVLQERIGESLEICTDNQYNLEVLCINDLIEFLNKAKNSGAKSVKFECYISDGCLEDISISPILTKLESEKKFLLRVKSYNDKLKKEKNDAMQKEISLYEKLKSKYGDTI